MENVCYKKGIPVLLIALAGCAAGRRAPAVAPPVQRGFVERDGRIAIEAENASAATGWVPVPGASGAAMQDAAERHAGYLAYDVRFTRGGRYYVFLLCRHTSPTGKEADDAFVTLDGEKLYASDHATRPDGMQARTGDLSWSGRPKGPGPHTPVPVRAGPVYFQVPGPGTRTLKVVSRSRGFVIDKVVLQHEDPAAPAGTGPAETR